MVEQGKAAMIIYERQEEEEEETKGVIEELGVVAHGKSLMVTQVHAMQLHLHILSFLGLLPFSPLKGPIFVSCHSSGS